MTADLTYPPDPRRAPLAAERPEAGIPLAVVSEFEPAGDQPEAIEELTAGLNNGERDQVLLGVTGSGKTFTMAHVIANVQRPALILAPNKTLAAQLYGEMKSLSSPATRSNISCLITTTTSPRPTCRVQRHIHVEKGFASINEQIDRLRHSADTRALFERDDVIIVASVSCIYGIGSVRELRPR